MGFRQGGQSLPLMIVFILILFVAFVYLFNTGQLLHEKSRLAIMADQAAYAAAVQNARILNLNAYLNRAAITNQLAVAQAVSMASWASFAQPIPRNASILLTPPMTPVGVVVVQASQGVAAVMRPVGEGMGAFVLRNQLANRLIREQQRMLNVALAHRAGVKAASAVMMAGGQQAQGAQVRYLATSGRMDRFLRRYAGDDRQRLAPVIMASREPFTRARKPWNREFGLAKCKMWAPNVPYFELVKRGGTQLLGLDEWKGMDTFSVHTYTGYWKSRRWRLPRWVCGHSEYPVGYGSTVVATRGDQDGRSGSAFDGSWAVNPVASSRSAEDIVQWDSRRGRRAREPAVPVFYDLAPDKRDEAGGYPVLPVVLKVSKLAGGLKLTGRASALKVDPGLQRYAEYPLDELSALARAETYFDRPHDVYLNQGKRERASLFNPYWRARLVPLTSMDRMAPTLPQL